MKKNYCKGELLIIGEDVQEQTYLGCGTFQVPVYKVKCKECNHILLTDKSELTIKEDGVSLKEGSDGVKTYYEIAKIAYMEGLTAGLRGE